MKIYNTPYGDVELELDTENIIVRLSGGFDSALMTMLIAMNAEPNTVIHPITVIRGVIPNEPKLERIDITPVAKNVVQFIRENCGRDDIEIRDNVFDTAYNWNSTDSYANTQSILINNVASSIQTWNKRLRYIQYNGVTMNPPIQIAPDKFHNGRVLARDNAEYKDDGDVYARPGIATIYRTYVGYSNIIVEPFANADKRITMWLANHIGLLQPLLNVTRSCEGDRVVTENWTKECMTHCWWCYERYWALENFKETK
jgi:hypothetical protein